MTELINFEEESFGVGSLNHSFAQAQITTLLSVDERFITFYTITAWTKGINLIMSYYQEYKANCVQKTILSGVQSEFIFPAGSPETNFKSRPVSYKVRLVLLSNLYKVRLKRIICQVKHWAGVCNSARNVLLQMPVEVATLCT